MADMDSGIAAVLGALAGSVATIGAALATGWAQREGARIAARSEHRRERREPRHAVYRDLMEAATTFHHRIAIYKYADVGMREDLQLRVEDIPALRQNKERVNKSAIEVALVGPKGVSEASMKLSKWSEEAYTYVSALTDLHPSQAADEQIWRFTTQGAADATKRCGHALEEFALLAQAALDDDGSRK
ncbi:hypothetical protein [Streptomyces sp. NPDC127066]|uniref:hypothetical protein n=1 Tax=Streptomyces sp. NPDC127066 TaxID=3347125 RepID=UPI00364FC704